MSYWDRLTESKEKQIEKLLREQIEPVLGELGKGLKNAQISRWHWGAPDISLRWLGEDGINRNLHVLFQGSSETLEIEVAGWQDDVLKKKRNYCVQRLTSLKIPDEIHKLKDQLQQAVRRANFLARQNLTSEEVLPSNAVELLRSKPG